MMEVTVNLPNKLAARIGAAGVLLPTIIELGLLGFRTRAADAVADLIDFLRENPSPQEVLLYHTSEKAEGRLFRLMTLSDAGVLSSREETELRELEKLEHIVVMLKLQARKILKQNS